MICLTEEIIILLLFFIGGRSSRNKRVEGVLSEACRLSTGSVGSCQEVSTIDGGLLGVHEEVQNCPRPRASLLNRRRGNRLNLIFREALSRELFRIQGQIYLLFDKAVVGSTKWSPLDPFQAPVIFFTFATS